MLRRKRSVFPHIFLKKWGKIIHKCCNVRQDFIYLHPTTNIRRNILHTNAKSNSTMSGADRDEDKITLTNRGMREGIF